jgi:hypothetical protein
VTDGWRVRGGIASTPLDPATKSPPPADPIPTAELDKPCPFIQKGRLMAEKRHQPSRFLEKLIPPTTCPYLANGRAWNKGLLKRRREKGVSPPAPDAGHPAVKAPVGPPGGGFDAAGLEEGDGWEAPDVCVCGGGAHPEHAEHPSPQPARSTGLGPVILCRWLPGV